jgi:hypothetical protein
MESNNRYKISFISADKKYLIRRYMITPIVRLSFYPLSILGLLFFRKSRNDKVIFIVGASRSGTTVFLDIFKEHERIANWSEAPHVFESDYYNKEKDNIMEVENLFYKYRLKFLIGSFLAFRGRNKFFLNKHPQNSYRVVALKKIFPKAKFIHVIRNGHSVVASNYLQINRDKFRKSMYFGGFPKPRNWKSLLNEKLVFQLAYYWADVTNYLRDVFEESNKIDKNYIEVFFEEFCNDTDKVLANVDDFCGLDHSQRINQKSIKLVLDNNKWKKVFTSAEISKIENITSETMRKFNYIK